jgi:hypothetical protein
MQYKTANSTSGLRDNDIRPRFNDAEYEAIVALARLNERKPGTFVRDLVLRYLATVEQQAIGTTHAK